MATVSSLVCFGGLTGKAVTFTDAGDVVNLTKHGLRPGSGVVFSSSGSLPSGITSGATYYAKIGADQDKFLLYPTEGDAVAGTNQVSFTGTGSGTHICKSAWMLSRDVSAYGGRVYDSLVAWNIGRAGAAGNDVEVCEIGEAFTEIVTGNLVITIPSAKNSIRTKIGTARSEAFHRGNFPQATLADLTKDRGYVLYTSTGTYTMLQLTRYRDEVDGISFLNRNESIGAAIDLGTQCSARNCFIVGTGNTGSGINFRSPLCESINNVITRWYRALQLYSGQAGVRVVNNTVVNNYSTLPTDNATMGFYYNNIIIGNTTDWTTQPTGMEGASNNYGPVGAAWMSAGATRFTIATSDFVDFANNDFRPANASSPQVETGIQPWDLLTYDIADGLRPNYMGGAAAEIDGGAFEFDHGYGLPPATATISVSNIVSGSRVLITRDDTGAALYNEVPGVSLSLETGYIGNFSAVIRKASESPFYREFSAGGTTVANQTTSIKALQQLDE